MSAEEWYFVENTELLDTPCLVVFPDRIQANIRSVINSVHGEVSRLRPHIKTNKSADVTAMMLNAGITKFKCATIAEAEMLANAGAEDVMLAYQPVGPKVTRFLTLVIRYPMVKLSCLVDNIHSAKAINLVFEKAGMTANIFIDLNVGMNRSGIAPHNALKLFEECAMLKALNVTGLHAYDGHLRDRDFEERKRKCDEAFEPVFHLRHQIEKKLASKLTIIAGGTPTFPIHCQRKNVESSPGTFIYWDKGYEKTLPEQQYLHAALVVTRVISIPTKDIICVDLGHKSIASENPLPNRVFFLNAPELEPVGHSEEHLTLKTSPGKRFNVGDLLYGVPYHICPTVALHDSAFVIQNQQVAGIWQTVARKRKITI